MNFEFNAVPLVLVALVPNPLLDSSTFAWFWNGFALVFADTLDGPSPVDAFRSAMNESLFFFPLCCLLVE